MSTVQDSLHALVLRLTGHVSDELVARARCVLDVDGPSRAAAVIASGCAGATLTERDLSVLAAAGASVPGARIGPRPEPRWRFRPDSGTFDEPRIALLVVSLGEVDGAIGLWRAWRDAAVPVYLVAVRGGDPAAVAGRLSRALLTSGDTTPRVEVLVEGERPPEYQRRALAAATLLWSARPVRPLSFARVYDGFDDAGVPRLDPARPRLDAERTAFLLDRLRAGHPLLTTALTEPDVLQPDSGSVVPLGLRTDGVWIWSEAVTHYVERHRVAPEPGLLRHLEAAEPVRALDSVSIYHALAALGRFRPEPMTEGRA
ncbi:hypothetical protein [Lentzea sp. NBRC 102530]|uniref:hypothetical protein n=1 Tax=Lentzea sp. NBRC 102530 TaxID=3032201 RepID=UPI0024A36AE1|nr:hypothetical protein [Lentzea sp. NBRC 102530]GLY46797.1 hypothetical protein Lesp01_04530 [Lentzea sp. NBRC 102530]